MTTHLSRRDLLQAGVAVAAANLTRSARAAGDSVNPHYFLQIILPGGADNLYMFDSRPLSFTAAGRAANYGGNPSVWEGVAGGRCLASPFAAVLKPYKNRIAIVNGVHMPPGFEGHDQNTNGLLSANPFGGKYFGPFLASSDRPLDFVISGSLFGVNISNNARSLSMTADTAPGLADKAAQVATGSVGKSRWRQWISDRLENCSGGEGMFSDGCRSYAESLIASQPLANKLAKTRVSFENSDSAILKGAKVAFKYFSEGIADVFLVTEDAFAFDTHSETDAAKSPEIFTKLLEDLKALFATLVNTPFDAARGLSMLDVTTVMISSEFGRTHGQKGKPVDKTGTDHNPQANMVLLAGKGIKGDLVVGASDLDVLGPDGNYANVSAAHKLIDSDLLKRMGKPYDFSRGEVSSDLPTEYKIDDYISIASVINTVLSSSGVSEDLWMSNGAAPAGGERKLAKVLTKLLD